MLAKLSMRGISMWRSPNNIAVCFTSVIVIIFKVCILCINIIRGRGAKWTHAFLPRLFKRHNILNINWFEINELNKVMVCERLFIKANDQLNKSLYDYNNMYHIMQMYYSLNLYWYIIQLHLVFILKNFEIYCLSHL